MIRSQVVPHTVRMPVVYHASEWGAEIVRDGEIRGGPIEVRDDLVYNRHHHGMIGISTTRNLWFARMYAPAVFVLDWNAVRSRFRTVPRAEGAYGEHDYRLEAEELVIAPSLPLERYCLGILLDRGVRRTDPDHAPVILHPAFAGYVEGQHG